MITLAAILLGLVLIFFPVIYWGNKKAREKYNRPAFSLVQTIYVAVAMVVFLVGVGNLPAEFQLSRQEPMTEDEYRAAKAAWASDLGKAEEHLAAMRAKLASATDALDRKDASERIKAAEAEVRGYKKGVPPTTKTVWNPGVLLKFVTFPIATSLEIPALCFAVSLSVLLGIFVYNGIQMDWITATGVFLVQILLAIPLIVAALFLFKAFQNKQQRKPMLSA